MAIHPSAIVDKTVELEKDVEIGPFAVVIGQTRIHKGTVVGSHARIGNPYGRVIIGEENQIMSSAMIGGTPQDVSYKNQPTELVIGNKNIFSEFTTINCGTEKGGGRTVIGNQCLIMAYVHIAHDCRLGNGVIIANLTQFAGHVEVDDYARIGGLTGIVQFVKIGKFAYLGGASHVNKDVIPFSIAEGAWAKVRATNKIGLTRAGFAKEDIEDIHRAIKILILGNRTTEEVIKTIESEVQQTDSIKHLLQFMKSSENGLAR